MKDSTPQTLWGMPYDFRTPNWTRIKARMWNPNGPMLSPRVWGWGYTLNFAHPGSWAICVTLVSLAFAVS